MIWNYNKKIARSLNTSISILQIYNKYTMNKNNHELIDSIYKIFCSTVVGFSWLFSNMRRGTKYQCNRIVLWKNINLLNLIRKIKSIFHIFFTQAQVCIDSAMYYCSVTCNLDHMLVHIGKTPDTNLEWVFIFNWLQSWTSIMIAYCYDFDDKMNNVVLSIR